MSPRKPAHRPTAAVKARRPRESPGQPRARARRAADRHRKAVRLSLVPAGALALTPLGLLAFRGGSAESDQGSSTNPVRFDLPALDRKGRVTLTEFRGKPVVVNFFASWCTACVFELPGFAKVSEELKGDVTFVGVNALE